MKFPAQMTKDLATVADIVRGGNHSPIWLQAAAKLLRHVADEIDEAVMAATAQATQPPSKR